MQTCLESPVLPVESPAKWLTAKWYALSTRSRHEKLAARELQKKGFETFLPLRRIKRHWSDRVKTIEEPLFKGYLFAHAPYADRVSILNTAGITRFVGMRPSDPIEIPETELLTIRQFIEQEIPVDPFPYLREGERVYVRSGPFKGAEGFIVRKDKQCRLVISLDLLMQSVSIQIDQDCVEPVYR